MWPAIYFLGDGSACAGQGNCDETDLHEGGFVTTNGSAAANTLIHSNCLWASGCNNVGKTFTSPSDLSTGYHIYGAEYVPGQRWSTYFDGTIVGQWATNCTGLVNCTTSSFVPSHDYEVIIDFEVACGTGETGCSSPSGFRTTTDGVHNGPYFYYINDVQLYRK
ncbi:MAG TPA: hypothetical protein VGL07_02350 [Buttiauxella sp.]|jgi:hypothetical protein